MKNQIKINESTGKKTVYKNALSYKWDNKRVTVVKEEDGWMFEFKKLNPNMRKTSRQINIHGISITQLKLSKEAATAMMLMLADQMGCRVVEK